MLALRRGGRLIPDFSPAQSAESGFFKVLLSFV